MSFRVRPPLIPSSPSRTSNSEYVWTPGAPCLPLVLPPSLPSKKHPDREASKQLEWWTRSIRASREQAARTGVDPWRIVTLHHPVRTPSARGYLFGLGGHQEDPVLFEALARALRREESETDQALMSRLEPLLESSAIDAVFAGHNHFYARLVPEADGIRHFVSGGGGTTGTGVATHRRKGTNPSTTTATGPSADPDYFFSE